MIAEDNEKQDKIRQLAASSVETKQKAYYGLYGKTRQRTIRSTCKQTNREEKKEKKRKEKTQAATTPAASTYNITVDPDGLKSQDNTTTV